MVGWNVVLSGSNQIRITFNNDTGSNYADKQSPGTTYLSGSFYATQAFDLEIEYNTQSTWKKVSGWWIDTGFYFYAGFWKDDSAITEIDLTLGSGTYTSGTFKLYGTN